MKRTLQEILDLENADAVARACKRVERLHRYQTLYKLYYGSVIEAKVPSTKGVMVGNWRKQ